MNLSTKSTITDFVAASPSGERRRLLTPIPGQSGHFLMVLDNSSLEKFTTCPTSAYFYLVKEREAQARTAALVFGGAVHAGLEKLLLRNWHGSIGDLEEKAKLDKECGDAAQDSAIVNHFTKNPSPPDYRTPEVALEVLQHYRIRASMPDYTMTVLSDAAGPIIERAFELPLGVVEVDNCIAMPWLSEDERNAQVIMRDGVRVVVSHIHLAWSGRIDACANTNGLNRILDHKTSSIKMDDKFAMDFRLSSQVLGYIWAGQQLWPEHNIRGFCVNGIYLAKPGTTGTYPGGLMARGPRGGTPPLDFQRFYFEYSQERIDWWEHNTKQILSDLVHCLVRNDWPSHTKWCFGKYGKCGYHDVCSQDSHDVRESMIVSDMFKPVTWNPVHA